MTFGKGQASIMGDEYHILLNNKNKFALNIYMVRRTEHMLFGRDIVQFINSVSTS